MNEPSSSSSSSRQVECYQSVGTWAREHFLPHFGSGSDPIHTVVEQVPTDPQSCRIPTDAQSCRIPTDPKSCRIPTDPQSCRIPTDPQSCRIPTDPQSCRMPTDPQSCQIPTDPKSCRIRNQFESGPVLRQPTHLKTKKTKHVIVHLAKHCLAPLCQERVQ